MSQKVVVFGSRDYPDEEQVREFIRSLPSGTVVISGGARGVDTWAEQEARAQGLEVIVHPADWDRHGKKAGFLRNAVMVREADAGAAFWDRKSSGTRDTMERLMAAGKKLLVMPLRGEPDA